MLILDLLGIGFHGVVFFGLFNQIHSRTQCRCRLERVNRMSEEKQGFVYWVKGSFTYYLDKILFFDIFYGMIVDKNWTFLDHLPTSSCKCSLRTSPKQNIENNLPRDLHLNCF